MPGIDDAAYSIYSSGTKTYQEAVDYCQKIGGKVVEPSEATNKLVSEWVKGKHSYIQLGIKWNQKHSEFQYQSNATRIGWSNFYFTSLTINSCGDQLCVDDNAAVIMDPGDLTWSVSGREVKWPTVCETTVSRHFHHFLEFVNCLDKDWAAKKVTIFNSIVCLVKTSENILFFTCILPDYVADEITKEF